MRIDDQILSGAIEEFSKEACCIPRCNKKAQFNINTGPLDSDNTQSCLEHIGDLLDDSKHFIIDEIEE